MQIEARNDPRAKVLAGLALFVVTLAVFAPVHRFDFIAYDDPGYLEHPRVVQGLTWENVVWAMVATDMANWHPVTWLSHLLDAQLWGSDPRPPHLENAFLHAVNATVLFLVLESLTRRLRLALIAAALFALHPLRVESVAWVSERKDLLCAFFSFLTIEAYAACVRRPPSLWRYLAVVIPFLLALMSKPMAVTLPFVLLLLDYWPLGRLRLDRRDEAPPGVPILNLLAEKLPLFVLAAAASLLTVVAQSAGGAVATMSHRPLAGRLANSLVAYVRYIANTLFPSDLVILYPLPASWPPLAVAGAAVAIALVTALALLAARRWPFLVVGWFWFLGTLVPVIGIVQVGMQSIADRYTYIPGVGLVVAIVWGVAALIDGRLSTRAAQRVMTASVAAILCVLVVLTLRQLRDWQGGTYALFRRAVDVHEQNPIAHYQVAYMLAKRGETDAALSHVLRARALAPYYNKTHYLYGNLLRERGRLEEAIASYRTSLELKADFALAWQELAIAQAMNGDHEAAERSLAEAVKLNPALIRAERRLVDLREQAAQRDPATKPSAADAS